MTDASGVPVADGAKVVQFKIYDAPTGGAAVWNGEVQKLTVNGGLVSTLLGSKADLAAVDFNQALYLEITVDANADNQITVADPPLLPRQSILPAVFAVEAQSARTMDWVAADGKKQGSADWSALFGVNINPATGTISGTRLTPASIPGSQLASNLTLNGTTSGTFSGNGSALTNLTAANISGQLASSQLAPNLTLGGTTAGIFSGSGAALTNIGTSALADGAVMGAKIAPDGISPDRLLRDIAIFSETKGADAEGGGVNAAGWIKRALGTPDIRLLGAQSAISLNGDTVTLQPGTYYVRAVTQGFDVSRFQAVLRDTTVPATPVVALRGTAGSGQWDGAGTYSTGLSLIDGIVVVSGGPRQYEIWQFNTTANASSFTLGVGANAGPSPHPEQNIYTRVVIERLK